MESIIVLEFILISRAGFQNGLTTQSRSLKLTVNTLCLGFLVNIINRDALILVMFKRNLKALEIITFEFDSEKIEVEM